MTVTIYASMAEEVTRKLEAVKRKAEKIGLTFAYSFGEPHVEEIKVGDRFAGLNTVRVEAVDVEYENKLIRRNGWQAVAKVEHMENGNFVTPYDFRERYPEAWHTVEPFCEHCRTNHQRSVTYMVRNENGEIRQVGSGCLKEYTGIDPYFAVSFASLSAYIEREAAVGEDTFDETKTCLLSVRRVLAHACDHIRKFGYVKRDLPNSTADYVRSHYREKEPTPEGLDEADRIMEWVKNEEHQAFTCAWECEAAVRQEWCKSEHVGRLAWLPAEWKKWVEEREREARRREERERAAAESRHIGTVGEKISVMIRDARLITSWETQWGYTYFYRFTDVDGNVLVWYSSSHKDDAEYTVRLTGKVKDHTEYEGVKQTVLTRCALTVEKPKKPEPEYMTGKSEAEKAFESALAYFDGEENEFGLNKAV